MRLAVARHLRRVGFAVKHTELAAVTLGRLDGEPSGDEGEQIRGDRLRLGETDACATRRSGSLETLGAVRHGLPSCRDFERSACNAPSGLAGRSRETPVRARRNEQRVQKLAVAIQRLVAGDEVDGNFVLAGLGGFGRNRQVTIGTVEGHSPLAGTHTARTRSRGCAKSSTMRCGAFKENRRTTRP